MRKRIPLAEYVDFVERHHDYLTHYVNLDEIPGTPGANPTSRQVDEAAHASWSNYLKMREAGLDPWPVFHIGERFLWLEKMVSAGAKYVALGGIALVDERERRRWLDDVFHFLSGNRGYPMVKVHGLGVSSAEIIHRYPWASTDSTTWLSVASNGAVLIPAEGDFERKPLQVEFVTKKLNGEASTSTAKAAHFKQLGPGYQRYVTDYLKQEGYEPDGLEHYVDRRRLNVRYFLRCAAAHRLRPFRSVTSNVFRTATLPGLPSKPDRFRFYFASDRRWMMAKPLHDEGARNQLLSYYMLKDATDLREYVLTGEFPHIEKEASK
jgi:hypothetical protein